jgi:hypothetical protein
MARYYICGKVGTGTMADPYRPEIVDESGVDTWCASQEAPDQPCFCVSIRDDNGSLHAELAYDATSNPNGYDWFEVAEDGTVTVHAA